MEKIKALYKKYEEIIVYLIVGVLTTIVSWGAKFTVNALFFDNTMYPTPIENAVLSTVNWTAGVIFAYFTNRRFVFKSKEPMRKEAPKFVLSRVSTWVLDAVAMMAMTAMNINLVVATLITAVLVTVANYVFSKIFVFNKKKNGKYKKSAEDEENTEDKENIGDEENTEDKENTEGKENIGDEENTQNK